VALGTTLGFFLGGFPIVVVMRALSHVVFVMIGALWLRRHPYTLLSAGKNFAFNCVMAFIHAVCEVLVVMYFYFGDLLPKANYSKGFVVSVLLLVGVGTLIHSSIDFYISVLLWKALGRSKYVSEIFTAKTKLPA
jgi:niacin transporter